MGCPSLRGMPAGTSRRVALTFAGLAVLAAFGVQAIPDEDAGLPAAPPVQYRLLIAPGGDPMAIRLDVDHAEWLEINAAGDLVIRVGNQTVHHARPRAYQDVNGIRHSVRARFEFAPNGDLRVAVDQYDRTQPLTIAPLF